MLPACTITFATTSVVTPLAVSPEEGAEPGLAAVEGALSAFLGALSDQHRQLPGGDLASLARPLQYLARLLQRCLPALLAAGNLTG